MAIELQFINPLGAFRQRLSSQEQHRLDESGFRLWHRLQVGIDARSSQRHGHILAACRWDRCASGFFKSVAPSLWLKHLTGHAKFRQATFSILDFGPFDLLLTR